MFRINSERCLNYRPHLPRVPTQQHFKKMYTCKNNNNRNGLFLKDIILKIAETLLTGH